MQLRPAALQFEHGVPLAAALHLTYNVVQKLASTIGTAYQQ